MDTDTRAAIKNRERPFSELSLGKNKKTLLSSASVRKKYNTYL